MKFPKHRAFVFLVTRRIHSVENVLGVFAELDDADNFKDACVQEWFDRVGESDNVSFHVDTTTFYSS